MSLNLQLGVFVSAALGCAIAADPAQVVRGNTEFACDLFGQLKSEPGNLFFSPFSISTALAMTAAGAQGPTLAEMVKTLHLPESELAHAGFAELMQQFNAGSSEYQLAVANALWGQKGFAFRQDFLDRIAKYHGGGLRDVDFKQPEPAAATINRWVSDVTKDRIKDLVSPQMLKPLTRLVLTNAIYFKGQWQYTFRKELTRDEPFFVTESNSNPVPMMHLSGDFRFAEVDGVQVLELPYKGRRLSMVLLLPKEKHQLAKQVQPMLNPVSLARLLAAGTTKPGNVALPRFEFRTSYSLGDPLQNLGMKLAFSNGADFTGMTTTEPLKIDLVIHKAFVKTDEEGSEAAAATAVIMERAPAPIIDRFNFRADHPFVFMIRDNQTGSLLFLGRVSNPKS